MNLSTKHILLVFFPIILILVGIFTVQVYQYQPLYPDTTKTNRQNSDEIDNLPIFPSDPVLGDENAPKTIVTFEDLGCPACKDQYDIFQDLIEKHPNKIKVVWKSLTVKKIPVSSKKAHRYAYCMNKQNKFKEFAEFAFANGDNLRESILKNISKKMDVNRTQLSSCLESNRPDRNLQKNEKLAQVMNVQSVPSVFINGKEKQEPETVSGWENLLNIES